MRGVLQAPTHDPHIHTQTIQTAEIGVVGGFAKQLHVVSCAAAFDAASESACGSPKRPSNVDSVLSLYLSVQTCM